MSIFTQRIPRVNPTIAGAGLRLRTFLLVVSGILFTCLAASDALAQLPGEMKTEAGTGDRVVAIVGKQVFTTRDLDYWIFESRVLDERLEVLSDEDIRLRVISRVVDDFLLAGWAELEIEEPPKEAIETRYQDRLRILSRAAGGAYELDDRLRRLGFVPEEFRRWLRDRAREDILIRDVITAYANLGGRDPADTEIGNATRIQLSHLVVRWAADDDKGRDEARRKALRIRRDIEAGIAFDQATRLYSDDPVTAESGGLMGWFQRGEINDDFWVAATGVNPGRVTEPLVGKEGYHLLMVVDFETPEQQEYARLMREEENRQIARLREEIGVILAGGYKLRSVESDR